MLRAGAAWAEYLNAIAVGGVRLPGPGTIADGLVQELLSVLENRLVVVGAGVKGLANHDLTVRSHNNRGAVVETALTIRDANDVVAGKPLNTHLAQRDALAGLNPQLIDELLARRIAGPVLGDRHVAGYVANGVVMAIAACVALLRPSG